MPASLSIGSARAARPAPESYRRPRFIQTNLTQEDFQIVAAESGARREESPLAGNSFELVDTLILKINSGPRHEIFNGSGDKHTPGLGLRHDARAGVHRDAANIVAHQFAFASVHSRAYVDAELSDSKRNGERAAHCSRRTIERRQKTVAGSVGFLSAEARQFFSHDGVVRVQKIAPWDVAKLCCALGGRCDIEEETVARMRSEESIGRSPVMNS